MKLIKILPALAMTLTVSAYAKEMPKMEKASDTMATLPAIMDKTVVYTCNKKLSLRYINLKIKNLVLRC